MRIKYSIDYHLVLTFSTQFTLNLLGLVWLCMDWVHLNVLTLSLVQIHVYVIDEIHIHVQIHIDVNYHVCLFLCQCRSPCKWLCPCKCPIHIFILLQVHASCLRGCWKLLYFMTFIPKFYILATRGKKVVFWPFLDMFQPFWRTSWLKRGKN